MNRRPLIWLMALAMLTLLVAYSAPAFPADDSLEIAQEQRSEGVADEGKDGYEAVERILQQQEQLLQGQRFSYDPEGRRDPFRSLFERRKIEEEAERPPGPEGMMIDEMSLTGIVRDSSGGDVAYFTGSDNRGYFLRVGARVYDGTIIGIDSRKGSVTFRQKVEDPRQIKPYRDVERSLEPLEE